MTFKQLGIQVIRKTIITGLSITLALCITTFILSSLPQGM